MGVIALAQILVASLIKVLVVLCQRLKVGQKTVRGLINELYGETACCDGNASLTGSTAMTRETLLPILDKKQQTPTHRVTW